MKKLIYIILFIGIVSCKENRNTNIQTTISSSKKIDNSFAKGFSVIKTDKHTILKISNPWPKAKKEYNYLLLTKEQALVNNYNKDDYNGIITIPIKTIVVTSTTHIPALELLGVEQTLVGFPGTDYVSSKKTRQLIDQGKIRELGKNESINTEVLLKLKPDLVVGFGVNGVSKTFETIQKSGIPVLYNGDWVETSVLAKAEWVKFFGTLFNKEKKADSIFNTIKKNYSDAKKLASKVNNRPTVLSGALHKDVWYLPSGTSPEAQFLRDANANYLWSETTANGSLALSFETVFKKARNADLWISPSYYSSLKALKSANTHYTQFEAFKNKNVYSFVNTTGKTGGVLYYELGTARPDLVLKDLIKICYPELLKEYTFTFFKPLK